MAPCIVVDGLARDRNHNEQLVWGILSDVELMRAVGEECTDEQAGSVEIVTIGPMTMFSAPRN